MTLYPSPSPFRVIYKTKRPRKGKKASIFALYCFAFFWSYICQDGNTRAGTVLINCQLTRSCAPTDKTHWFVRSLQLFFTCQSYVMMYRIMYHIVTVVLRCVLYCEKLYCCSPISHIRYPILQLPFRKQP